MFLAIDRVTKFVHVAFFDANTKANGAAFLREVVEAFPYAIHTVLTDNGMAFADLPKYRDGPTARWMGHVFDRVCREHGIEHRLTKPYHPWTNGQAERMNRTVKEATIKAFHYPGLEALKAHVLAFVRAYNFAKHLKALRWRTPFQAICDAWTKDRSIFKINPHHLIPGPNILVSRWLRGELAPFRVPVVANTMERSTALTNDGWDAWRISRYYSLGDRSGALGLQRHTSSGRGGPDARRRAATPAYGPEKVGATQ
jgi:hypothetical protein